MADLFEQVLHHLEGEENEIQNWKSETGERAYSVPSFGPERWIERAALGRLMAIDVLALILFSVRDTFDIEQERRIVDGWAAELRKAASDGEIQARDTFTLLALGTLPTDWEWLISISDADKFVVARGMSWKCSEQVEYLLEQARQSGTRYLDPKSGRLLKHYWLAGYEPQPAPAQTAATPTPVVEVGASDDLKPKSNLPWWQVAYDIHDMAQNIGAKLHSEQKGASNAAIAREIEKRINDIERRTGRSRTAPNHDTIRGLLTGWTWRPE